MYPRSLTSFLSHYQDSQHRNDGKDKELESEEGYTQETQGKAQ